MCDRDIYAQSNFYDNYNTKFNSFTNIATFFRHSIVLAELALNLIDEIDHRCLKVKKNIFILSLLNFGKKNVIFTYFE